MQAEYLLLASFSIGAALFAISHVAKQFLPSAEKKVEAPPKITVEKFDVNEILKTLTCFPRVQSNETHVAKKFVEKTYIEKLHAAKKVEAPPKITIVDDISERWKIIADEEFVRAPFKPIKVFAKPEKLNFFIPKEGTQNIVILPAADLKSPFFITRKQHYLDPNGAAIMCPKRVSEETKHLHHESQKWTGDCPICNQNQRLWAASSAYQNCYPKAVKVDPRDMEQKAKRCKGMKRFYYNISVLDFDSDHGVSFSDPMIWSVGILVHSELQNHFRKNDQDPDLFVDVNNIDKCNVLMLLKTTKGIYPNYKTSLRPLSPKYKNTLSSNWSRLKSKLWDLERVAKDWEKSDCELALALANADVDVPVANSVEINTEQIKGRAGRQPIDEMQELADKEFLDAVSKIVAEVDEDKKMFQETLSSLKRS